MKPVLPLKYITSLLLLISFCGFAQDTELPESEIDSLRQTNWGFRVGINILPPLVSIIDKDDQGLEIIADYRFKQNWYLAAELGRESYFGSEDFFDYNTKGNFAKIGVNYNAYNNWLDMNNEIFIGGRYGFANFTQKVTEVTYYNSGTYFPDYAFNPQSAQSDRLNAHWFEMVAGLKVETFKNLFLGVQVAFSKIITEDQPEGFENLFVPGIGRTSVNNIGTRFSYTISYLIPFKKK